MINDFDWSENFRPANGNFKLASVNTSRSPKKS